MCGELEIIHVGRVDRGARRTEVRSDGFHEGPRDTVGGRGRLESTRKPREDGEGPIASVSRCLARRPEVAVLDQDSLDVVAPKPPITPCVDPVRRQSTGIGP